MVNALLLLIALLQGLALFQSLRLTRALEHLGHRLSGVEDRITAAERGNAVPRSIGSTPSVRLLAE